MSSETNFRMGNWHLWAFVIRNSWCFIKQLSHDRSLFNSSRLGAQLSQNVREHILHEYLFRKSENDSQQSEQEVPLGFDIIVFKWSPRVNFYIFENLKKNGLFKVQWVLRVWVGLSHGKYLKFVCLHSFKHY